MIPVIIHRHLGHLRGRERLLQFVWGVARWISLVLVVIALACFADWLWDRFRDTPRKVHYVLLGITCAAFVAGLLGFIIIPLLRRLHDDELALWVEDKIPVFRHRLISAVQLNRPTAQRQGMSTELIALVTQEAETEASGHAFAKVADHRRLGWAARLLFPVVILAAIPLLIWTETSTTLLARHFLSDIEIPRDVYLQAVQPKMVRPAGDKVTLAFRVRAKHFDPEMVGDVYVTPKGMPRDRYPLEFADYEEGVPIFTTVVGASTIDFEYTARLGDGRLRAPGRVQMVPRPAVAEQTAWTILPDFVGTRDGERFEIEQPRGDIVGINGSAARVRIETYRPIAKGHLEMLAPRVTADKSDTKSDANNSEPVPEDATRQIALDIAADGKSALARFDLKPEETGYRVILEDEYGFANIPPPRRTVRVVAEEAPTVNLLKDYFTPGSVGSKDLLEDFNIDGIPVPIGETIRVPYVAEGPYGLGQAWFLYRVIRLTESGNEPVEDEPFKRLPLSHVKSTDKSGFFDPRRGVFENTPDDKSVDFFAMPLPEPGRMLGGGRFHFRTSGIADGKGGVLQLREGDKIEYCIEIHADAGKHPERPVTRSETRVQTMGSIDSLIRWAGDYAQEVQRLNEINRKQRSIFDRP